MGWLLAIISGVLAGFSHETRFASLHFPNFGFLGFFCWIPLLFAVKGVTPRRALALSFVAAFFHYGISQYWLYSAIHNFGHLNVSLSIIVMILLFVILSFYFALIFWWSQWFQQHSTWPLLIMRPLIWVSIEYLRNHLPANGYPWSQVGYSQSHFLPFIQSADIFGVHGTTFLLVLANEFLFYFWTHRKNLKNKSTKFALISVATLFVLNFVYGFWRSNEIETRPALREMSVGIVQGNIPQDEKWERSKTKSIMDIYRNATQELEYQGAELVVWPEASVPRSGYYDMDQFHFDLKNKTADVLVGIITRSMHYKGPGALRPVHNSAMLIGPGREVKGYYHKSRLVPFGEYVPFEQILFFARKLTAAVGSMQPGLLHVPIPFQDHPLGILICYEDVFPDIARNTVVNGAQLLVNMSNDAWYGFSSAPFQHQAFSRFRAIENRRAVLRATNTGMSSLILPSGNIVWQGGLFTREYKLLQVPFSQEMSIYSQIGDVLPQAALLLLFEWTLLYFIRLRKQKKTQEKPAN